MVRTKCSWLMRAIKFFDGLLYWVATTVDYGLTRSFHFLGGAIADRPWLTIFASTLCAAGCLVGFMAFEQDTSDTLFTPSGAQSIKDARYISALYSGSLRTIEVQFFAARLNNEGQNILTVEGIKEMQRLWDKVVVDSRVTWEGDEYSYTDVCTPISSINDGCRVRSVLQAFNFNENNEVDNLGSNQEVLDYINDPNFTDVFQRPMRMEAILGGITRDDNGRITAAEAFASNINLQFSPKRAGDERSDPLIDKWEEEVVDLTLEFEEKDATYLQVYVSNSAAASSESTDAINRDVRLLIVGYVLIIVWCAVSLNRNSWVYQKFHLAFWAVIAIILGAGAAFGLVSACGVKFNLTIQVSPFLLLGLGIDDTFVLIGTYFQQVRSIGAVNI
ncbi:patched family-domain-containing protein [Dunaliella salina]|uniref:Patched family-domain-containing protein n=1 Tax=Dunaliella salina TaxID=3046 RepID=A0ABQ7GUP2_DUNSA|nr:patched family-domain-containing protein [Dunaliella salina]|eukprot:KAF5838332.1 patched family-domain-containing protein [Dunaliella salina]